MFIFVANCDCHLRGDSHIHHQHPGHAMTRASSPSYTRQKSSIPSPLAARNCLHPAPLGVPPLFLGTIHPFRIFLPSPDMFFIRGGAGGEVRSSGISKKVTLIHTMLLLPSPILPFTCACGTGAGNLERDRGSCPQPAPRSGDMGVRHSFFLRSAERISSPSM